MDDEWLIESQNCEEKRVDRERFYFRKENENQINDENKFVFELNSKNLQKMIINCSVVGQTECRCMRDIEHIPLEISVQTIQYYPNIINTHYNPIELSFYHLVQILSQYICINPLIQIIAEYQPINLRNHKFDNNDWDDTFNHSSCSYCGTHLENKELENMTRKNIPFRKVCPKKYCLNNNINFT